MSRQPGVLALVLALLLGAMLALGPSLALAQTSLQNSNNAGQTSQPAQSQPMTGQNPTAGQPNAAVGGTAVPHQPAPARTSPGAGDYWWWVAAIIIIVLLIWGVPRVLRSAKGSSPRSKS